MSNEPDHVPEALYPCGNCTDREGIAHDANYLRWRDTQWLCEDCTGPGCTGITLADWLDKLARRDTPAADGLPVEMVEGDGLSAAYGKWPGDETDEQIAEALGETADPINAAYQEAIKAEDVPEWAVWVAIDKGGLVNYFTVEPRHLNVTWELCYEAAWAEPSTKIARERMKSIDWTKTLRRVDAVWPQLKKGGAK